PARVPDQQADPDLRRRRQHVRGHAVPSRPRPRSRGVTVSFDDTALTPDSVTELGDITAGGFIYLTRSKFKVPANATPGVRHVTATASFGDVMLSNGPDLTVTAPAK